YEKFKEKNILTRKYFYPACTDYECYKNNPEIKKDKLEILNEIKNKVLCLPFYGDLRKETLTRILEVIKNG
ncbi:DegT/DnrJ/EryC1/StrS family aminotransferase, partial [bacterium]|nr:DegT/DnrJ/EryC1/StrS family aminotransferase [bacterium]